MDEFPQRASAGGAQHVPAADLDVAGLGSSGFEPVHSPTRDAGFQAVLAEVDRQRGR